MKCVNVSRHDQHRSHFNSTPTPYIIVKLANWHLNLVHCVDGVVHKRPRQCTPAKPTGPHGVDSACAHLWRCQPPLPSRAESRRHLGQRGCTPCPCYDSIAATGVSQGSHCSDPRCAPCDACLCEADCDRVCGTLYSLDAAPNQPERGARAAALSLHAPQHSTVTLFGGWCSMVKKVIRAYCTATLMSHGALHCCHQSAARRS